MRPERYRLPKVVVPAHQLAEQQPLLGTSYRLEHNGLERPHLAFEQRRGLPAHAHRHSRGAPYRLGGALGRQPKHSLGLERFEKLAALPGLEPAPGTRPLKQPSHRVRELHAAQTPATIDYLVDQFHLGAAERLSAERGLFHFHAHAPDCGCPSQR